MSDQPAGWYADPGGGAGIWRWWDGTSWTSLLSDDPAAPPPAVDAGAALSAGVGNGVSRGVAVLAVLATALVGVLVIGLVVWISEPRLPTGPAMAPPAPQAQVARVDYKATSLTAKVDEVQMTLPAGPYQCDPRPGPKLPAFESLITCNVLVHEDYNAAGDDWYASVGFGAPAPALDVAGDLAGTADRVFEVMREALFTGQQTAVQDKSGAAVDLGAVGSRTVYGDVTYEIAGLPSSADRLFVLVVELQSGDFVVAYSSRPTDLDKSTLDTLNTSLNSITAR